MNIRLNFGALMIIFTKGIVVSLLLAFIQANCVAAETAPYDLRYRQVI
jgi:hypothetical protein